ncbi:MAG TPA: Ku protein [Bryobacteraceae bacterium]|nr:Ku protein [Bryobacteraceae bacterium]
MASTVWKGYLTFGLISVPVRLFVAARTERISFNQIHEKCGSRIKQQTWCPVCERVVERNELKKGFEVAKGRFVIIEDEDIKKIAPQSSEAMEILEFVRGADIDPIYFDSSYFMVPEDAGRKAYELLFQTMEKSGYSAIAKIAMHQREYTVVIRPHGHGLTLHTMFYPEEVRAVPEYGSSDNIQIRPQEVSLAEKLVEGLAAEFDPSKYHDEYQSQLSQLIEAKKEGLEVQSPAPKRLAPVIDLMQALQQSLGQMPQKKPASKVTTMEPDTAEQPRKKQRAKAAR